MAEKIVKNYDGCEVTLVFGQHNPELKENVLELLLESYRERISDEFTKEYEKEAEERKAS